MAKKIITSALVIIVIITSIMTLMIINTPKYGIIYYDLGEYTTTDSKGNILSYPLTGVIGVPKNIRNAPIAFILHDQENITDLKEDKYYSGFEYLVKSIADNGIIAVSINLNSQYKNGAPKDYKQLEEILLNHLDQITKSAEGRPSKLGVDLNGKADLGNISLIGHGLSGQAVYIIANDFADKNIIKSIIMINPENKVSDKRRYPDLPTAVLISEYNGNSTSFDGYYYFDRLNTYNDRKNIASIALLKGANDNFFNSYIKTDDVKTITQNRLSEDEQRYFTGNFCTEFIKSLSKKSKFGLFSATVKSDERLFGFDVLSTTLVPNRKYILDAQSDKRNKNSLDGLVLTNHMTLRKIAQSTNPAIKDQSGFFSHPIDKNSYYYMYEMSFESKLSGMDIIIPSKHCDFSLYDGINLYLAPNPYSPLTIENVKLDVILTDNLGNQSAVSFDNMSALNYYSVSKTGGEYTPLSGAKVPLSAFKNADLKNIVKVTVLFKNTSANLMLSNMYLFSGTND